MNLIDFVVVEVMEEKYDKIYKLFDMSKEEAIEDGAKWLFHDGCSQTCKIRDMGGEKVEHFIHDISTGNIPYKVGSRGLH